VFATSGVSIVEGSRVRRLLGSSVHVKCYHHQAIDRLGAGLVVSAVDADGVIEAVELTGPDFVVAVQWHPEETLDDLRIFSGLVDAARDYATATKEG
jgi:putative glutamine amidotransferase